ncbi:MAG TPA: cytochrome c oxidase subunit II [Oligoflexus sp.]|uniref:cytochrome c oxidase subunit II n=1 Tax=Oligoflexus sp. TaxID=1971216 RepID=UPI002D7EF9EC|nr:cytochrome c oxidase subunit II [Oligoflexus sp.]HET9235888.1 cytochrome c oxidase subunit II [Oligoflexus sp.]
MLDFMSLLRESASTFARDIDHLIAWVAILGGFWWLIAEGVLVWLIVKFRHKEGVRAQYITGEKKEEMKWIHWPHNLILLCDVAIIIMAINVWYNVKQKLPPADDTIRVIGQQWSWRFVHSGKDGILGTPDDVETVEDLHVQVGKTYHFKLETTDVLHNFSVPVFRLKQDSIPGRVITGWFKPTMTGTFDIQCAEMCGIGHGIMMGRIHVQTPEEYDQWLSTQQKVAQSH